jgi:hypothetical protein
MTTQPVVLRRRPGVRGSSQWMDRDIQQRPRTLLAAVVTTLCTAISVLAATVSQPTTPSYRLVSWSPSHFKTSWGVSCEVNADSASCQSCVPGQVITNAYTCSDPAPGVAVTAAGIVNHNAGAVGSSPDSQPLVSGQTYHDNGWTIVASGGWARFINDATGHGMAVAAQNFDSF